MAHGRVVLFFRVEIARNANCRERGHDEQTHPDGGAAQQNFTDAKERRVDEHTTE